jgi:hypothetical protein
MDNLKSFLRLVVDLFLIIALGAIIYSQTKDKGFFLLLGVAIFMAIYIVVVIKNYFKEIKIKNEKEFKEARRKFNKWYVKHLDKKEKRYWVDSQNLTPCQMFGEVVKNSETGKKIVEIVKEKKEKGESIENIFKSVN